MGRDLDNLPCRIRLEGVTFILRFEAKFFKTTPMLNRRFTLHSIVTTVSNVKVRWMKEEPIFIIETNSDSRSGTKSLRKVY